MAAPDGPEATTAKRFVVDGRVQGVGFRWWTYEKAAARNLGGYVLNRRDGRVEIVAAGPPHFVDQLEQLVGQGPPGAYVSSLDVEVLTEAEREVPQRFEIRRL